jgi:hypothetical protein
MLNMKKIYALLMLCLPMLGFAQNYNVTFKVNTANITVGPNGLYAGGGVIGGSNAVQLTDPDGNGVYEGTTSLSGSAGGNFIFFNSPTGAADWGTKENLTGLPCADPANYDDRILPTFSQDTTLLFCFGTCANDTVCPAPPPTKMVTFVMDARDTNYSYTNVYIAGSFNGWCETCNPMSDPEGDSIWTASLPLTNDSIEYKFLLNGWLGQEEFSPGTPGTKTTGIYTNRFAVLHGDTILDGKEYNSGYALPGQVYLTMQVNMSYQAVDSTGVFLAGGGNFGNPGDNEMYPIGDSIYSKTVAKDTGFTSFFTFTNGACGNWGCKENLAGKPCGDPNNFNDRSIGGALYSDFRLRTCFGECSTDGTCPVPPTPVNVTFQSDRNSILGTFTTAYVSGTMNGWSGDADMMSDDDGDGVYTATLSLLPGSYEFKYTADSWAIQENFDPATSDSVCTLTTGIYTNRFITIGAADTTLDVQCWEECGPCANIGIEEEAASFVVKPNPASDVLFIENTTGTASNVAVYSITGARVMEATFDAEARLDVASLPRGMYIVRVQNGMTEKVVRVALK